MRHASVSYFGPLGERPDPERVALTDEGLVQADAAGALFASQRVRFDRVLTSGLPRTVQTAERVLARCDQQVEIERDARLRELRSGSPEAIAPDRLRDAFLAPFEGVVAESTRYLGGESVGEMLDRVLPALDDAIADRSWQTMLMVLHGGVNRVILSRALTGTRTLLAGFQQAPACINAIDVAERPRDWVLRYANLTPYDLLLADARQTTMERLIMQYLAGVEARAR
ncbi:MAG: histidine phosphatase family protein [Burkholderiales bacterium]|nr:MAG: histidine phosphatase family protein [Burkholderiales bacterium]